MAFAPDAVIFIPGSPLRTHDRHRSFVLACPLVSVWGSFTATLPRDVAVTSCYAAVSSMGLSSWGFRYSTLSGKGSFVQDVFLAHPQKSTSQGCGFNVCQLGWRGRAIV